MILPALVLALALVFVLAAVHESKSLQRSKKPRRLLEGILFMSTRMGDGAHDSETKTSTNTSASASASANPPRESE